MKRNRRQQWPQLTSGLYVPPLLWLRPDRCVRPPLLNPGMMNRRMGRRCCCTGPCHFCAWQTPFQIQLVIEGLVDENDCEDRECVGCTNLNDTFVLEWWDGEPLNEGACEWRYTLPDDLCGRSNAILFMQMYANAFCSVGTDLELPMFGSTLSSACGPWTSESVFPRRWPCISAGFPFPNSWQCQSDNGSCLMTAL